MGKPAATDRRRLKSLSHSLTLEIRRMTQNGASPKVIAEVLDLPIQTVQKVLNTRTL